MKSSGIVRKIDGLGRIVLPKELRNKLGIDKHDSLEIYIEGDMIILKAVAKTYCLLCGSTAGLIIHMDKAVCSECFATLSDIKNSAAVDNKV